MVQPLGEVAARDILQGQIRQTVVLADLMDGHDVGMVQARDGVGLALEAGSRLGASVLASQNHLQGHQPARL